MREKYRTGGRALAEGSARSVARAGGEKWPGKQSASRKIMWGKAIT